MKKEFVIDPGKCIEELRKLAKHGLDYLIAVIGLFFSLLGIFMNKIDSNSTTCSEIESLAITIFGMFCVIAAIFIWFGKKKFKERMYLAQLDYKKYRLQILSGENETHKRPDI